MKEIYTIFAKEAIRELCPKYKFGWFDKDDKEVAGVTYPMERKIYINWPHIEACGKHQRDEFLHILFHEITHAMFPFYAHDEFFYREFHKLRKNYGVLDRIEFRP